MTLLDLPYQAEGASFLASRKAALLADDPGLGKSKQAIDACDIVRALRVLVICPASVVENWRREIAAYRTGDWSAFVTSYDRAAGADYRRLLAEEWDVLVLDEAHYLKNLTAKRTNAVYGKEAKMAADALAARAAQVWLLTGTPMPNNPSELYSHLRALHVDAIRSERTGLPWTFFQFVHAYCLLRSNGFGDQIVGSKNEAKLNARLDGFMLRRRKADVLPQLPPLRFSELWMDGRLDGIDGEEAALVRATLDSEGVEGLKRLAANGSVSTLRRLTGMAKAEPAAAWVSDWLDSTPADRKIVVFAHHKIVIDTLYDRLHARAVRVDGSMKQGERQRSVDRLQKDPLVRVFIGQLTAAGTGITLTAASDLLFVESSFVPAEMQQAAMRIHRIGQAEPCLVRFAMIAGSIDEVVQRAIMRKIQSITRIVDGAEHDPDRGIFA